MTTNAQTANTTLVISGTEVGVEELYADMELNKTNIGHPLSNSKIKQNPIESSHVLVSSGIISITMTDVISCV